jgi:hypothetical protein
MAAIRQHKGRWQARVTRRGFAPETRAFESKKAATRWARTIETDMDRGNTCGPCIASSDPVNCGRTSRVIETMAEFSRETTAHHIAAALAA